MGRSARTASYAAMVAFGCAVAAATGLAQAPAPAPAAPATTSAPATVPLLWRIESATPAYLFGTIHVPDERVLAIPAAVQKAFDEAGVVYTEIPMDAATQVAIMGKVMLPGDQKLGEIIGGPLFDRMTKAVEKTVGTKAPSGTASMLMAMMARMKPWAAMSQLSLLEFLPDLYAGRQPLDMMLWSKAVAAGKKVDALETVDEQLAVFDAFSAAEQTRMLELTLESMEKAGSGRSQTRALIDTYLTGDLDALVRAMNDAMASDRELMKRFTAIALDARNRLMVERIRAKRMESPGTVQFFAVGAAHYAGDSGIVSLLEKSGVKVTRMK
jgi:uncharacterized protein YbaP (TraB family)